LFYFNDSSNEFQIEMGIETKEGIKYIFNIRVGLINGNVKPEINQETLSKVLSDNEKEIIYTRDKDGLYDKDKNSISIAVDKDKTALSVYKNPDTDSLRDTFLKILIPDLETINDTNSIGTSGAEIEKNNLASILVGLRHKQPDSYTKFQAIIKKLLPHFSSLIEVAASSGAEPSDKESFLIVLEEQNLKGKLSMQSVSGGDLRTLFLVASTLSMEDNSTLIVEEIENGMHPKRIIDLLDHLETIARVKNMQVLFTTHNPMVINSLSPAKVLFVEKEIEEGTKFKLLEDTEEITKIKKLLEQGAKITDYLYGRDS